ncbi:hypothetical protein K1719_043367 [Acacia pycnantha]|nr:hypothetical protein K1719_043367 [Acacia pycnantha]
MCPGPSRERKFNESSATKQTRGVSGSEVGFSVAPKEEEEEEEEVEEEEDEGEVVEEIEEGDVSDISSVGDNEELLNGADESDNLLFPYEIYEGLLMIAIDEYQAACIERGTPIAQYRRYMVRMRSIYDNSRVNGIVYPPEQRKKVLLYFLPRTPEWIQRITEIIESEH